MKPILLKFDGFYNYTNEEIIDFSSLNEARLFGIFGRTGAGKSAILDAMSFALFGKIDRLAKNEKKAFINTYKEKGHIEFTFEINKGSEFNNKVERYKVERTFRIRHKRNGDTEPVNEVTLYDENENVIASKPKDVALEVEKLINIKEDDYYKIVCLPQGKFSEFLHQTEKDRVAFLKKIFDLEKYDVTDQINALVKSLSKDKDTVERQIISRLEENFQEESEIDINNFDSYKTTFENKVKEITLVVKDFEVKSKALEKEKEKLSNESKTLEKNILSFNEISKLEKEKLEIQSKLESLKKDIDFATLSEKINTITPHYKNFLVKENYEKDLNKSLEKNNEKHKSLLEEFSHFKNYEEDKEKALKVINDLQVKLNSLQDLDNDYKKNNYEKFIEKLTEDLSNTKKIYDKNKLLVENVIKEKDKTFLAVKDYENKIVEQEKLIKILSEREVLAPFLLKLEEENICPLCGSDNHPNKIQVFIKEQYNKAIEDLEKLKKSKIEIVKNLIKYINEIYPKSKTVDFSNGESDFIQYINTLNEGLFNVKSKIQKITSDLEYKKKDYTLWQEKVQNVCGVENFKTVLSTCEKDLIDKNNKYKKDEELFKKFSKEIKDIEEIVQKDKAVLETTIKDKDAFKVKYKEMVEEYKISNFEEIYITAFTNEKIESIKKTYITFEDKFKLVSSTLEKEKINIKDLNFEKTTEDFEKIKLLISEKDIEIKKLYEENSKSGEVLKNTNLALDFINNNYNEYVRLKETLTNYELLNRIVGKKKLVNHLINMKMRRLIDNTNIELSKVTNGKYAIGIKENTEFFVKEKDNGYIVERDIKSLSGGETFLFSLCLSLALSRELQSSLGNKIDFYFIDEGFGTLDNEKLHMIYNMLRKLSKDMTIGLITHVPIMKNLIQNKILVGEDLDGNEILEGSKITVI